VTVYSLLEQTLHIPWVIQAALLAAALLLSAGVMVRRQLATAGGGVMPDEGVTVRNVFEVIVAASATWHGTRSARTGAATSRSWAPSSSSS
jgi:hypothetical protein